MRAGKESIQRNFKVVAALAAGGMLGSLTLAASKLSSISNDPVTGIAQRGLFKLLLPGMIGAEAFSGNAHAWSLWIAAGINSLIYFILGWVACSLLMTFFRRRTEAVGSSSR